MDYNMKQGYFFFRNAFQAFSSENLKKLQLCMTGKEAFRRNAIDWKHLDEQERLKYRFKADLVCTCYSSGLIVQ